MNVKDSILAAGVMLLKDKGIAALTQPQVARAADSSDRVVVTKDSDFRDGHLLAGRPRRLLVVGTGNITNNALLALFDASLVDIVEAFEEADFIELQTDSLIVHPRR